MEQFENELSYYEKLNNYFRQFGFLPNNMECKSVKKYAEKYKAEEFSELYQEKCLKYLPFSMAQSAYLNYVKLNLWQESFGIEKNKEALLALALDFNLYCVILDRILDNDIIGFSKQKIWDSLNWKQAEKTFYYGYVRQENDFLDFLLNRMAVEIKNLGLMNKSNWREICENIKAAFESEQYMAVDVFHGQGQSANMACFTDKSVKFVKAYFQIAGYTGKDQSKINLCGENVGILFWLVDDLCDVFEDLRDGFCNSVMICEMRKANDHNQAILCLTNHLEHYLIKMRQSLDVLKENTSKDFYDFILWEISDWCENVSRRLER